MRIILICCIAIIDVLLSVVLHNNLETSAVYTGLWSANFLIPG